jgi:flagellar M-ring protein FliF
MNTDQVTKQLQAIWKQLGLNQRVSIVLATLAVFAALGLVVFWTSRPDYSLLYGRLDEAEAAKVIAALDESKTPYRINRMGGSILVPSEKVHLVRMQLAAKGIPRGEGVGFEIFDKANFGLSDFVQRANYVRALQGELGRTISQVEGIDGARVMIVVPENRLLLDNQKKPTASVFVRLRGSGALPAQTVEAIRFLVANSVEGLAAANVSVVDNLGNVLSENAQSDSIAGLSGTQLSARKNVEQYLARKTEGMLEKVLGPGQSVVRVAAEINFDSLTRTEEKFDPDGQVVRTATINDENVDSTAAGNGGGVPGVSVDANGETNSPSTGLNSPVSTRTRKKVTNNQYELNRIVSNMMQNAGGLKRLSAAVFIAARMSGSGTNRVATPRPAEEMTKIKRVVQSALGIQENDPTRRDEITVEEMPFNEQTTNDWIEQSMRDQHRQFWWDLASRSIYPALAIGMLFFFWRMFRRTPTADLPIGVSLEQFLVETNGNGHGHGTTPFRNGGGTGKNGNSGVVTVEVLNQLIRENPNNMTQAIRGWMLRSKPKS